MKLYSLLRVVMVVNVAVVVVVTFRNFVRANGEQSVSKPGNTDPLKQHSEYVAPCPPCNNTKSPQIIRTETPPARHSNTLPVRLEQESKHTTYFQVPNIVHYIWYNDKPSPFKFHHMLSVLSADKYINPTEILFHTNNEPMGTYWDRVKKLPKFKVNKRAPPKKLFGQAVHPPMFYTSNSNVDRVKVLSEYGGIYLDLDVLVTKSFDELRRYVCTVGLEHATNACGSIIVCSNTSFFLYMWMNAYLDDYRIEEWAYNTGKVPFNLARRFPHLVNMEPTRLNRPNYKELDKIWGPNSFNWQDNYAVHLWYRLWKDKSPYYKEPDEENVKTLNNTFGQMARTILYGSPQFIASDQRTP